MASKSNIKDIELTKIAKEKYYEYGLAVNEDRSVPGAVDGLKPVARRALWALYCLGVMSGSKHIKSARAVGETMGKYHPHGDKSIYDTYVNMANGVNELIDGKGNWGSLSGDSAAAQRYTNMRMSKYAEKVFFNKFYLPTVTMVPNYDGSEEEPLILPALLPNLILNGTFGIGVGVSTFIPAYTVDSLIPILKKALTGTTIEYRDCRSLIFKTVYGGEAVITKTNKTEIDNFYKTGKGKIKYLSIGKLDEKKKVYVINKFAPINSFEKVLEKSEEVKEVAKANDSSSIDKKTGTAFNEVEIIFKKTTSVASIKEAMVKIEKIFSVDESYDVKVTDRFLDSKGNAAAKLRNSSVPDIINTWAKYRIQLEKDACQYWITKYQAQIDYLNLMRLAIKNLDFIIKCVKDEKLDDAQLMQAIATKLKITVDQADQILKRNLRQLRALEDKSLIANIQELEKKNKELRARDSKPGDYAIKHLDVLLKELK